MKYDSLRPAPTIPAASSTRSTLTTDAGSANECRARRGHSASVALLMVGLFVVGGCSDPDPSEGGQRARGSGGAGTGGVGDSGTGGVLGTGGVFGSGGVLGGGGDVSGSGGVASASGGTSPAAGGGPAAGSGGGGVAMGPCTFEVTHSLSDVIGTVGIVEFSTAGPTLEEASIEFGLDTAYGMTAPVDLTAPNHRTLLLGMKTDSTYHFRVSAKAGTETCTSQDYTLTTAARPAEVVAPEVTTPLPEQRSPGFLITSRWGSNNGGPAFILDADNDLVWWYFAPIDVMRVRMSYDGKWMWMRNTAQEDGTGAVLRLSLDGMTQQLWDLPRTTHDLAVLPDGKVGLIEHTDGCDRIIEFDPETETTTPIFDVEEAHGSVDCHVNYLAYSGIDDSYYISDFFTSSYVKITRGGELRWVLNGEASTVSGSSWEGEHGIHVLAPDHFLIFSNGARDQNSLVLEYQLNETETAVTEIWRYDANLRAQFGGDLQRLENGNTLISYSSVSTIQEVNPQGELVQEHAFPRDHTVSYISKRATLYGGPPPKVNGL